MKRIVTKLLAFALAAVLAVVLTACGNKAEDTTTTTITTSQSDSSKKAETEYNAEMFTERDLDASYKDYVGISLKGSTAEAGGSGVTVEEGTVTITEAGTYLLTGTFDGQIVVKAGSDDKVQLVLDGVTLTNSKSAAIYVQEADKVFLTLKEGSKNTVSSSAAFTDADAETGDKVDAVIFSKEDLVINGSGALTVTSDNGHGIVSKDDLKVTGGTLKITAKKKGLVGKDSVRVHDGKITITAEDDGIHTSNDEDEDKGFVYIEGGTFTISSGDDGIHAEKALTITGGNIDIQKSYEGLEGQDITISGGNIQIVASDDGINASEGGNGKDNTTDFGGFGKGGGFADNQNATLTISGGTITVNAGGDGLDSNGSMVVSGGTTYVSGPTNGGNGALDCDNASISGGTVIAAGSVGMAVNFGSDSTQCSMLVQFDSTVKGGTEVVLKDSSGNTVLSFTPEKDYQSVVLSSKDIQKGETYTVSAGNQSTTVEMTDTIYGTGNPMGGPGGMGGQRPDGNRGGREGFYGRPGNISEGAGNIDAQSSATL